MTVSLTQLRLLASLLGVTLRFLVRLDDPSGGRTVSLTEVVDRVRAVMEAKRETADAFSERVGWDVASALLDPDSAWTTWNLDMLIDVCNAVGIAWSDVLPGSAGEEEGDS